MRLTAGWIGDTLRANGRAILRRFGCGPGLVAQPGQLLQRGKRPHHAGHGIAVSDGDGGETQIGGAADQFLGMRRPTQEAEI